MVFGIGGGSSESKSRAKVWEPQGEYLQQLYAQAMGLVNRQNQSIFGYAQEMSADAMQLLGGASDTFEQLMSGQTTGASYLRDRIGETNPYLAGTIQNYGEDIARNLAENILPELRSGGVAAGAPGGSRAYIAQGMAADAAQREFSQGAQQMRYQDVMQRDALASQIDQFALSGAQGMAQLAEPTYNLGMSPYDAPWMPLLNMGAILGAPTVLNRSDSSSWEFSI